MPASSPSLRGQFLSRILQAPRAFPTITLLVDKFKCGATQKLLAEPCELAIDTDCHCDWYGTRRPPFYVPMPIRGCFVPCSQCVVVAMRKNEQVEISIKSLSCGRYNCRRRDFPECECSCHACVFYVYQFCHLPPPSPSLLSSTDFAGENLHYHIEPISQIDRSSKPEWWGPSPGVQNKRNHYVPYASPCASFFFFPLYPVWFSLLRLLAAVNKCARNAIVMPSCNSH